jgi:hypothetical protein
VAASRHCPACDCKLDDRLWCPACLRQVRAWTVRLDRELIEAGREASRTHRAAVLVGEETLEGLAGLAHGPGILERSLSAEPRPGLGAE